MEKEKQIMVCRQHWAAFLLKGIIAFFCIVMGFTVPPLLFVGLFIVLWAFISYKTTYIALTETKLTGHKGFIKSRTLTVPLSKVQDIIIGNGLMGKIFGYHNISIASAGLSDNGDPFRCMAKAPAFVDAVQKQIEKQ